MKKNLKNYLKSVLLLSSLFACSTSNYNSKNSSFYSIFNKGQYQRAADRIKEKSELEGKDQILYLLDRGTALFEAGAYDEAIKVFTKAEKYTEYKSGSDIGEDAVSLMTSDAVKTYRPMDYEKIMINVYLALSYLMIDKPEDAMVECRRINNLVYKLKNGGLKSYEESPFAWYLSGLIYESQGKYDDARIDFNRAKKLNPDSKLFSLDTKDNCSNCGTIVIVYQSNIAPKRIQSPRDKTMPAYKRNIKPAPYIKIYDGTGQYLAKSYEIMNVEETAIKNLRDRIRILKNKKIAATVIKGAVAAAAGLATKDKDVAVATFFLLELFTRTKPDTRSWATLPENVQIAKINLPSGEKLLKLVPYVKEKEVASGKEYNVSVRKGETIFISYRYINN